MNRVLQNSLESVGVTGVCGSAIIEVVAEMFLSGIITEDGVIDGQLAEKSDRIVQNGRTWSYVLWRGKQEMTIRQTDVRAIQLAKAALYAGIKLLMDKKGIDHVDYDQLCRCIWNLHRPEIRHGAWPHPRL